MGGVAITDLTVHTFVGEKVVSVIHNDWINLILMQANLHTEMYIAHVICLTTLPYTECNVICKNVYVVNMLWQQKLENFRGEEGLQGWTIGGQGQIFISFDPLAYCLWTISLLPFSLFFYISSSSQV